jgi:membrane associated rhomboid family serine protease
MIPASVGFQCPECVREGRPSGRATRGPGLRGVSGRWGTVTLAIIAVNVVMFVVTAISAVSVGNSPLDNSASPVFVDLAQVPFLVQDGQWWRVLTAAFLHIGLLHLALNMLALLVFGSELESRLGRWRFAAVYLVSVLGGAAALQLLGNPLVPAAGASTAIYGLFGALGVLMLSRGEDIRGLVTLLVINVVISLLPGVSLIGHLGGLVAGALATTAVVLTRRRRPAQIAGLGVLGVALLVVALTVPTLAVVGL